MDKKPEDEKEALENDKCMGSRKNGDASGISHQEKPTLRERVKQLQSNKKNIVIIILCILLFIFFIVMISLAVQLGAKSPVTVPYCSTSKCLQAAAVLKGGLDETIDPCDDLWSYSCGNWLKKNPIPHSTGAYSIADQTTEKLYVKLRHLIDLVPLNDEEYFKPEVKIKKFYATCVNLNYIESAGSSPLTRIIIGLKGWDVFGTFVTQTFDKDKLILDLHVKYGVTPYFKFDVVPNPQDTGKSIVKISQSGLGMGDASMYSRNLNDPYVTAYRTFIQDLLQSFERSSPQVSFYVDNIFHYEKRIAEISLGSIDALESVGEQVTLTELVTISPRISWLNLLNAYFPDAKFTTDTKVLIQSRSYLKRLSSIISSTDDKIMNTYLIWRLVTHYGRYLSHKHRYVYHKYDELLTGSTVEVDRWQFCLEQTNQLFGSAMGSLFIKQYYDDSIREDLSSLAKNIIDTFANDVRNARWMDGRTKEKGSKKVKEIMKFVGYAAFILSDDYMIDYYYKYEVQGSYLHNILNGVTFHRQLDENKLIEGIDGSKSFPEFPQSQDVKYNLIGNTLSVPYGLLELPTYSHEYPPSIKYGSVGSIIAQKIVRSIDRLGSYYDELGTEKLWWTNTTRNKYNALKDCMIDYYDQYTVENVEVNGNLTLLNNLDDVVGLRQAYKAYLKIADDTNEKTLAGIGRTQKQQFFISYAQTFCQNVRELKLQSSQSTDMTAPNKVRVMAAISLLPEFREAFECTYRAPQCRVW